MGQPYIGDSEEKYNMVNTAIQQTDSKLAGLGSLDVLFGRLKGNERILLLAGVGFQVVVLLAMILMHFATLLTGDTILLRVVPVDPRDQFRGDYVILSYDFSRISPEDIPDFNSYNDQGRTVYVTIVPEADEKHWEASKFSFQKPSTGKFLRGQISGWNQIKFGIESYFVQEGEGLQYEEAAREKKLSAQIALDGNGKAVLKRLMIDEHPPTKGRGR